MSTLTMPTFIIEALSCYLTTAALNNCYSEVMAYTALAYSLFHDAYMDAYIMPTDMIPTTAAIQKP